MVEVNQSVLPTIFITGAGRRLGLHLTEYYLAAGWRVIAHYRGVNELSELQQKKYRQQGLYFGLQGDLAQATDVEQLIQNVITLLGNQGIRLNAIIHNASCFYPDDLSASIQEQWGKLQAMMAVHVAAPQAISLGLVSSMASNASIIALSDIYADLPNERFASYCSAKAGLQSLALSLAQRLAPEVRVNVIQPGPIKFLPQHNEEYRQKVLSQGLLKKELGYQAIQQGIDYLLTAKAVTGSILRIDGGRSCANRYEQNFI
jgi:dihydromonapterin reductase/dihydrofolate reductase